MFVFMVMTNEQQQGLRILTHAARRLGTAIRTVDV